MGMAMPPLDKMGGAKLARQGDDDAINFYPLFSRVHEMVMAVAIT